jgi:hypothetical protein
VEDIRLSARSVIILFINKEQHSDEERNNQWLRVSFILLYDYTTFK